MYGYYSILDRCVPCHALSKDTLIFFTVRALLCAGGNLSRAHQCTPLDVLCDALCNIPQQEELKCDLITNPQQVRCTVMAWTFCESTPDTVITSSLQSLSCDLLSKMATALSQNTTLQLLELRSDGLTQYQDAKLFTQYLMSGAARCTSLTEVCIGFSSWWRDCHIQCEWIIPSCIVLFNSSILALTVSMLVLKIC